MHNERKCIVNFNISDIEEDVCDFITIEPKNACCPLHKQINNWLNRPLLQSVLACFRIRENSAYYIMKL